MTDLIAIKTHNVIKTETQRDVFIILNNNFSNVSIQRRDFKSLNPTKTRSLRLLRPK